MLYSALKIHSVKFAQLIGIIYHALTNKNISVSSLHKLIFPNLVKIILEVKSNIDTNIIVYLDN